MNLDATLADNQPTSIGRYKILSELGRGSMAKVYLALDPVVDRKVALKVISPNGPVDAVTWQTLRTRFLLEARAAGKLQHPNAVAIYDADTDEESGLSYIAMEWVDGRSLDKMLGTRGPMPIETTLSIIQQVAAALDAAHSQGLIHRDIKPANILIGEDSQAKLSDFGIVKFEDMRLTSTGGVMGTPLYMSPEQVRGETLDGRSDLFSLGVVLYQCLTGAAPFTAETVAGLTHQILNANPRAPHWSDPSIPDSLSAAVLGALAKNPSARPQSGAELTQQLWAAGPAEWPGQSAGSGVNAEGIRQSDPRRNQAGLHRYIAISRVRTQDMHYTQGQRRVDRAVDLEHTAGPVREPKPSRKLFHTALYEMTALEHLSTQDRVGDVLERDHGHRGIELGRDLEGTDRGRRRLCGGIRHAPTG